MAASSRKALLGAVAANLAIAAVKFGVGALTRSTVMIAEGIHSLVDMGNSALMLVGESRSRRPADDDHPFGYGMELYFWSLVVAMVVFGGGGGVSVYEGVRALSHPRVLTHLWPNFLVIGAAAVFEGISLFIGLREFTAYRREKRFVGSALSVMRASKNPAIFVTVLEDTAALVGLALAAAGLTISHYLGQPAIEAVASILIGVVLMLEAALLGIECRGLIIGEAARPEVVASIRTVTARHSDIGSIESLRTLQLGPDAVMLVLGLRLGAAATLAGLEHTVSRLTEELRQEIPMIKDVLLDLRVSQGAGSVRRSE